MMRYALLTIISIFTVLFGYAQDKNSRLIGVLTPQIILRMYEERSCPVRTPTQN